MMSRPITLPVERRVIIVVGFNDASALRVNMHFVVVELPLGVQSWDPLMLVYSVRFPPEEPTNV